MKKILSILFVSLVILSSYAQTEAGFLKDAKNNFVKVGTSSTKLKWSAFPPDTIISFDVTMVNPGDVSTPPLAEGVQAYYSFEETSGSTTYDSAASYDGTITNTPTLAQTGISNYCFSYSSAGSEWIDLGTSFWDVGTDDLTVCGWIKTSAVANSGGIIGNYGTYPYWYIRNQSGSTLKGVVNFSGANIETQTYSNLLVGYWYHFVYQLDRDGNAKLYINNVLQSDQDDISASSAVNLSNSNTMAIGRIGNPVAGYYHNGLIDEVSIYNRLISTEEISNLYNVGVGKFWPYGTVGGDTLNMANVGFDPRGDSIIVLWKYESYSTDEEDGTVEFAFDMADTADYKDTNFIWSGLGDTTVYFAAFTGLNDDWTIVPNKDTVFIDSSDIYPPIQDEGIWDTIFYQDFEQHTGIAPIEYTFDLQSPDWNDWSWFDTDHQWPTCWATNPKINDSIVIDPKTGSAVLRYGFDGCSIPNCCESSYDGQTPARGGEGALVPLDGEYQEVYFSYNIMLRPGWLASGGGKFPGLGGGIFSGYGMGCPPAADEGFKLDLAWHWPTNWNGYNWYNSIGYYGKYPNMSTAVCPTSSLTLWDDFMPVGENLQYHSAPSNSFYFDVTDSTWYNITLRMVCNTFTGSTPNADGIIEGYINGYLIQRASGLILLNTASQGYGINTIWWRHFWGGGGPPLRDEWSLFDDIIIFTYDEEVDVPRGNEISPPGRVLNLPNWPKE